MNTSFIRLPLAALALCAACFGAQAQEAAASGCTVSANVGLFSQYIFRGISYTQENPAVQGGFDVSHESGAYLGV
jgi:uncharacterized protein (TIGR02001 family)